MSSDNPRFHSPPVFYTATADFPVLDVANEEDQEEDIEEEADSDSEDELMDRNNGRPVSVQNSPVGAAVVTTEPSELMQLDMSEDIRLGSPDDASNNLDSDFHLLAVTQPDQHDQLCTQPHHDSYPAESTRQWPLVPDPSANIGLLLQPSGIKFLVLNFFNNAYSRK